MSPDLPADTDEAPPREIDLRAEFVESGVKEVLEELDRTLVGLQPVKTRIREIAALLLVDRARMRLGDRKSVV